MFYTEIFHYLQRNKKKRIWTPYPESKDNQKNHVDGVGGWGEGKKNNTGGAGISYSFSSAPRRGLI